MNPQDSQPAIGQTISAEQFNALNTAAIPPSTQPNAGAIPSEPAIGQKISGEQFQALQQGADQQKLQQITAPALKGFNDVNNTINQAGSGYTHGLMKTYAGSVGYNTDTGQWEMPDFLKAAESGKNKPTDIGSDGQQLGEFHAGARNLAEGALRSGASLLNVVFAPITQAISSLADAATDNPNIQGLAKGALSKLSDAGDAIKALRESHPEASQNIDAASAFLLTAAGGSGLNKPISEVFPMKTPTFKEATKPPEAPAASIPPEKVAAKLKGVATDWAKPTTENTASFNKARAVLAKSPETPQFLAEQGLNPYSHIEDGKYETSGTSESLRDTAGKMSEDTLRPSLEQADQATPPTPVTDLTAGAKSRLQSEYNVTADDAEAISNNIDSKIAALQRKYPKGMTLVQKESEKINYSKNGGYSPVKDPSVNNNAIANRAMADALDKNLQATVPKEIDYKGFKTYLSKYYKAADYLDTLQGKKAPVSFGQMVARNVAKFAGAKAGGLLGGDIVSEFAGYQIGKALEHAVENLTNPMRDAFLKNLQKTNPEAFTKLVQYLGNEKAAQATRLRLPAPEPLGTSKNPIIAPGRQALLPSEKQTSAEMIKAKYTYNPVDKKYYKKGERGGNPPKPK